MENKEAARLISENLKNVYGYAFARLYDKNDVDDLTSEIVCEMLKSAGKIKDDRSFWAFMWKVAENTFRSFVKRKSRRKPNTTALDETAPDDTEATPERSMIEREEKAESLFLLRRELSLLSQTHRDVCLAYYFGNKSCREIAAEQGISLEMVKYHLFKTRRLLKEGIGMERQLGEKSYNPGVFRLNFWGDRNHYGNLFDRKLPGSILLAAYYTAMTDRELSLELGVAMPYLEDELKILTEAGVLLKRGDKYETNLVILSEDFENDFESKTKGFFEETARNVFETTRALLPEVRKLPFEGIDPNDNRLIISLLNVAFVNAFLKANKEAPYGDVKPLPLGGNGFIWGHDNDYKSVRFLGVSLKCTADDGKCWFSTSNYKVFSKCGVWSHAHWMDNYALTVAAIDKKPLPDVPEKVLKEALAEGFIKLEKGIPTPNFPVFEQAVYDRIVGKLDPVIAEATKAILDYSGKAAELLSDHCPASVKDQCPAIAAINYRLDAVGALFETLVEKGLVTVPNEKKTLGIWGVRVSK